MWDRVMAAGAAAEGREILKLFDDPDRAGDFSVEAEGLRLDYSKTALDTEARDALIELAEAAGVAGRREAMFAGDRVNETEDRAVLHTALRDPGRDPILVDGQDVMPGIHATLDRMEAFARDLRAGRFAGQGGPITDVVNIGIGGSDLGPAMAYRALAPYRDGPRCHFVSNVDGADVRDTLSTLDPERTLIVVASKTFSTIETMTNAATAREWMAAKVRDPGRQFAALSSNLAATSNWGIDEARVFGFEDWVGGRYSVWGPIGLSLMLATGPEAFRAFLAGGHAMDRHFRAAPFAQNLPVLLALVGIWHNQVLGHATRAVLPYDQRLARLPAYLQQLEMESNGKRVDMSGAELPRHSGPVVWGEPGTNGQHAFYQLLHQGTRIVPVEFLIAAQGHEPELAHQHRLLVANCLAQSEALMRGRSLAAARAMLGATETTAEDAEAGGGGDPLDRQARHRVFPGNRPSTTLVYPKLTPEVLGRIIALYEHRVFVEGVILGINSFDQWGVELGKELALAVDKMLTGETDGTRNEGAENEGAEKDGSTRALVAWVRHHGFG